MKADAGGRERFSGFHFGLDVWGKWGLNFCGSKLFQFDLPMSEAQIHGRERKL